MSERRIDRSERLLADYTHALDDLLEDAQRDLPSVEWYSSFLDAAIRSVAAAWSTHVADAVD